MKGVHPTFWPDGSAASPPFEEVGPTHVFEAAFHAEHGVGARRSQVFGSRSGPIHAEPCRPRPQLSERRNQTQRQSAKQNSPKNVRRIPMNEPHLRGYRLVNIGQAHKTKSGECDGRAFEMGEYSASQGQTGRRPIKAVLQIVSRNHGCSQARRPRPREEPAASPCRERSQIEFGS